MWVTRTSSPVSPSPPPSAARGGSSSSAVILAHVLMDLIPHWDYTVSSTPSIYGCCDFAASLAAWLLAWLALGMPFWMAFMGPLSGAPDWDVLIATHPRRAGAHRSSPATGSASRTGAPARLWGIGVQVAIMAASVAVVLAARPY